MKRDALDRVRSICMVRLDVDLDWDEVAGIVHDGFREVATKRLIAELDRMI